MKYFRNALTGMTMFVAHALSGCTEELPLYQQPNKVLEGSVNGYYAFTPFSNNIEITISVKNVFDETLNEPAAVRGTLIIRFVRETSFARTAALDLGQFDNDGSYNPLTGRITIDPGKSVRFRYIWNWLDDSSRDVRSQFRYSPHPDCPFRQLAAPETFSFEGRIVIYEKTGSSSFDSNIYFCHVVGGYSIVGCPPVVTSTPCFNVSKAGVRR